MFEQLYMLSWNSSLVREYMVRVLSIVSIVAALIILSPAAQAQTSKTVLDGVFSDAQAVRGEAVYRASCGRCHGEDLSGVSGPAVVGRVFIDRWREDALDSLYNFMREGMPPGRQRSTEPNPISDSMYLDMVAHVLKVNGYPGGAGELTADSVKDVVLIGKDGPRPVPDGSLIMTVGCLSQAPNGAWILFNATEPARNRRPNDSVPSERAASSQKPAGRLIFRLADLEAVPDFSPAANKGRKIQAKGYIVRQPNAERINLTSMEMLDSSCG